MVADLRSTRDVSTGDDLLRVKSGRKASLLRVGMFAIALFANLNYLLFIINPVHADNLSMFAITALADTIAIVIFTSTWIVALYFELFKQRYYSEVDELRSSGQYLLQRRVGVFVPVVNEDRWLIKNTVESLQALHGEKEIYLLVDARKPATRQLAADLNVHSPVVVSAQSRHHTDELRDARSRLADGGW